MLLQDDSLLELSGKATKGPSSKELVIRAEEMNPPCDLGVKCVAKGRKLLACLAALSSSVVVWGCQS